MMSIASSVRFSELSGLLERISRNKKSSEKQSMLKSFISKWRDYKLNLIDRDSKFSSFYPVMRLIMPSMDKNRLAYGIKEYTLAKLYCDILCLGNDHPDAKKLMHIKSHNNLDNKITDFSQTAYEILKNRSPTKGFITIEEINNRLNQIAEANGQSKKDIINDHLIYIFQNTNALDQKWLIRIILKNLSCGLSCKAIFKCYHPLSEDFYNVTNDLEAVCDKFQSLDDKVMSFDIQLFKPFKPMLSNRGIIENIETQMNGKPFIHEIKYDGERFQMHKHGYHYRYWSRNGLEWTNSYGKDPISGTLTPFIHCHFKSTLENCILDGEMMGYNMKTNTMGTKGEQFDIKSIHVEKSGYMPCFIVFDVLYINNELLTGKPLIDRKQILDKQILNAPSEGKIQIANWTMVESREQCLEAFNCAIEQCEEGLMVKQTDSVYKVNCRMSGWLKMKPDYVLGLHEELDCVIVGGFFDGGNLIRHFLCAIQSDTNRDRYLSFAKVGSGCTRKILYEFNVKMAQHWKIYHKESPPSWLILSGKSRDIPDIYIEPEKAFIVQLKAAEIINSEYYATGCTLRFSRIDCFREDKSPISDCMTLQELNKLRSAHKGKLALHPLEINSEDEELFSTLTTKSNIKKRKFNRISLAENFKATVPTKKLETDDESPSIFNGKEFCILISNTPDKKYDKTQLETFLYTNGGIVVQNPSKSTFGVVVNKITVKVQNLIRTNQYDVINADWLIKCLKEKQFSILKPSDFFAMKKETKKYLNNLYDDAGDSFVNELSVAEIKTLFEGMEANLLKIPKLCDPDKCNFLEELMFDDLEEIYLHGCVIHFHMSSNNNYSIARLSEINRLKNLSQLAGAKVTDDFNLLLLSHIIFTSSSTTDQDFNKFHLLNRERDQKFYLVSLIWLTDCIEYKMHINERPYLNN